ncbi:MA3 domain-containing protein [Cryptosporidium canis]|uniref:MA3 domain-containing protein n=1 Tax=Cryptosporidium canis TaxID=195482 RepID=A0ABQ8PCB1_9CRYT|nr:MA3 domain-containing protein [Cryptosporidium canis]KAJ1615283.1 MA3 domain-containing protein [Cryptosporidium canis]
MEDESSVGSPVLVLDKKDPVFDSESEDENVSYSVMDVEKRERMVEAFSWSPQGRGTDLECKIPIEEFRIRIKNLCQDYFLDFKTQDFINGLKCISCPSLHNLVVVIAIRMALDYSLSVQQQVSALLTILKDSHLITQQQIEDGLEKLIQSIDDICLDAPYSPERLECLVDCAILDGIIPSNFRCRYPESFLSKLIELRKSPDNSQEMYNANEINGLLLHLKTLQAFKSFIIENEEDFFSSGFNATEVEKIISDAHLAAYNVAFWNGMDWTESSFDDKNTGCGLVPSTLRFNHEFVKNIVISSMSRNNIQRELVSNGLNLLSPMIINSVDISIGFMRILGNLDDLSLDVLNACDLTAKFITRCIVDELLPPSFVAVNSILHMGGPGGTQALCISEQFLRNKPRSILRHQTQKIWLQNEELKEDMAFKENICDVLSNYSTRLDKRECIKTLHSLPFTPQNKKYLVKYAILHFIEQILSSSGYLQHDQSSDTNQYESSFLEFCDREMRVGISLLEYLLSQGFLDDETIMDGFHAFVDMVPDLLAINPNAHDIFSIFVSKAKERAVLPSNWKEV